MKANQSGDFYPEEVSQEQAVKPQVDAKVKNKKQPSDFQLEFSADNFKEEKPVKVTAQKKPEIKNINPLATINSDASAWLKNALNQYQQPAQEIPTTPSLETIPATITEGFVEGKEAFTLPPAEVNSSTSKSI
jgi:hypothetical protein